MIKTFEEFINENYANFNIDDMSIKELYDYLIKNYKQLGDDAISFNPSSDNSGCDEITIPFVIGEKPLILEPKIGEPNTIFSIDIPVEYKEYVSDKYEIDPEGECDDGYIRVFDTYDWSNRDIIDFIDDILMNVSNPALKNI